MLRNVFSRIFLIVVLALSASTTFGAELVTNGGFETGDFSGWSIVDAPIPWRPWQVSASGAGGNEGGTYIPVPNATSVQEGTYNAWNGVASDVGSFQLYQDITVPSAVAVRMTWTDRYQMNHTQYCSDCGTATYAVEVLNTSNVLLQTLYSVTTLSGTNSDTGVVNHIADLTAFQGQTIRIRFRTTVTVYYAGPGQVEIDAVSVQTLAPTSAPVSVTGRVVTKDGHPISRATVKITDQYGTSRSVLTDLFGSYRLDEVGAGGSYVIAVAHKRYRFPNSPALVNVNDQIAGLDFISAQ